MVYLCNQYIEYEISKTIFYATKNRKKNTMVNYFEYVMSSGLTKFAAININGRSQY